MVSSILSSKNKTTIPKEVVEALGVHPSGKIFYQIEENGRVTLTARTGTFASVAKYFAKQKAIRALSVEEMKEAARKETIKRVKRSLE